MVPEVLHLPGLSGLLGSDEPKKLVKFFLYMMLEKCRDILERADICSGATEGTRSSHLSLPLPHTARVLCNNLRISVAFKIYIYFPYSWIYRLAGPI